MTARDTENLSEKSFLILISTYIVGIILCMGCLCSVTWVLFGAPAEKPNQIETGPLILDVTVMDEGEGALAMEYTYTDDGFGHVTEEGSNTLLLQDLAESQTYLVSLALPKGSSLGYCKILARFPNGEEREYFTPSITSHDEETARELEFALTVTESVRLTFIPRYGTASRSDVSDGQLQIGSSEN